MAKIKPLGNRLFIRRAQAPTSKGGILLVPDGKEKPKQGTVIAVGPGAINENGERHKLIVKEGDEVLFSSYAGTEIEHESGEEYLIISEDDVLGIVA